MNELWLYSSVVKALSHRRDAITWCVNAINGNIRTFQYFLHTSVSRVQCERIIEIHKVLFFSWIALTHRVIASRLCERAFTLNRIFQYGNGARKCNFWKVKLVTCYLLLVTDSFTGYWFVYWLLIHLLVIDSVYWLLIRLLVTDSIYSLLFTDSNYWLLIRVTSYWFIYWFVYWLLIRFTSYWFGLLVTGYWFELLVTDSGY